MDALAHFLTRAGPGEPRMHNRPHVEQTSAIAGTQALERSMSRRRVSDALTA
jgi:hypothetical protein